MEIPGNDSQTIHHPYDTIKFSARKESVMKNVFCLLILAFVGLPYVAAQTVDLNNPPAGTVRILSGDTQVTTGIFVHTINDFNGDGIVDFAISAPLADRVYIVYGRRNYAPTINLSSLGPNGFIIQGNAKSAFGTSVRSPGDMDRDGKNDLAIGAPYDGEGGRVYVLKGNFLYQNISVADESRFLLIVEGASGEGLGQVLGRGGSIDNGSSSDLLIPSPSFMQIGEDESIVSGAAYIIYGQLEFPTRIINTQSLDPELTFTLRNDPQNGISEFASYFDVIGDFSGTGSNDIAVVTGLGYEPPQLNLRILHTTQSFKGVQSISQVVENSLALTLRLFPLSVMHQLSALTACDITRDGRTELILGFNGASITGDGNNSGVTAIVSNPGVQTGELVIAKDNLQSASLLSAAGEKAGFGISIVCENNYLFIGAPYASILSDGIKDQGALYTLAWDKLTLPGIMTDIAGLSNPVFLGREAGDLFGGSVAGLGDLNRDGYEDLLVSTSEIGSNAAIAYIVQANPNPATAVRDFWMY